jgi:predicted nucleic acid-binding protein
MRVGDASVVADWAAPGSDPRGPAGRLLTRLVEDAVPVLAPRLLPEKTANALITGIGRGRWSGAEADTAFSLLRCLPVHFVDGPSDLDRAWELSRRFDEHPVCDLVYVAVAERLGERLFTADGLLLERLATVPFVVRV